MKSNLVQEPVRSRMTVAGLVVGSLTIWACGNGTTSVDVNQVATQLAFTVEPTPTIVASSIVPAVQVAILEVGRLVAGRDGRGDGGDRHEPGWWHALGHDEGERGGWRCKLHRPDDRPDGSRVHPRGNLG